MNLKDLEHKKILIAGYGVEGRATEKYLKKYIPSVQIGICDSKDGAQYLDTQSEYDLVIKTPGIPKKDIHIPHTTATNIFFAALDPIHTTIGVTGTKGKSTTASLIAHIIKQSGKPVALLGNIGRPCIEFILDQPSIPTICVLELSSYQLDDIEYSPHISVVVSLFPDHTPYHGSIEAYYEAKHHIISHASGHDYYIYNPGFALLEDWSHETEARSLPYETEDIPEETQLIGKHNIDNIRAAVTTTRLLGISHVVEKEAVRSFQPLPHRLERVGSFQGITWYDDAISTTPESTIAALEAIPLVSSILLGGEDRGYDFKNLVSKLIEKKVHIIVLFPNSGTRIKEELLRVTNPGWNICETRSMKEAVAFCFKNSQKGTTCLLSTASPSYTLWKNFIEKGNEFQQIVAAYETHE